MPSVLCAKGKALYRLSYGPAVDPAGLEPATTRLRGDNPQHPARHFLKGGSVRTCRVLGRGIAGRESNPGPLARPPPHEFGARTERLPVRTFLLDGPERESRTPT